MVPQAGLCMLRAARHGHPGPGLVRAAVRHRRTAVVAAHDDQLLTVPVAGMHR